MTSRADRSWKLVFGTNELTPEKIQQLAGAVHNVVVMALKEDEFKTKEISIIEELKTDFEIENKSPGQRLRNVFYRLYVQDKEGYEIFEDYYKYKMERVIEHYKNKINP
jgi:hypothetical protein